MPKFRIQEKKLYKSKISLLFSSTKTKNKDWIFLVKFYWVKFTRTVKSSNLASKNYPEFKKEFFFIDDSFFFFIYLNKDMILNIF